MDGSKFMKRPHFSTSMHDIINHAPCVTIRIDYDLTLYFDSREHALDFISKLTDAVIDYDSKKEENLCPQSDGPPATDVALPS